MPTPPCRAPLSARIHARLGGLQPSEHTAVPGMAVAVGVLVGLGLAAFRGVIEAFPASSSPGPGAHDEVSIDRSPRAGEA